MIDFNFTKQEWVKFNSMKNQVRCAYTNQVFTREPGHQFSPTVERIFENQPYSPWNCVWVTKHANRLKAIYIENKAEPTNLSTSDIGFLRRIERIISSVENITHIQEPYRKVFKFNSRDVNINLKKGECIMSNTGSDTVSATTVEQTGGMAEVKHHNPELNIARLYSSFGTFIEQKCDGVYNLTYSQFKALVSRKNCMLTKGTLPESIYELGFFILDKTQPAMKGNIFVTDKSLQENLDKLVVESKLTLNELKNLMKVLGK
jgi:hypothetical protein